MLHLKLQDWQFPFGYVSMNLLYIRC
jgi:hypothetical protein